MPGYKQIADMITEEIAIGKLAQGMPVPSLHTICREYGVSYMTAVHVHEELERRNLIIRNPTFRKTLVGSVLPLQKDIPVRLKKVMLVHNVYPVRQNNPEYIGQLPRIEEQLRKLCQKNGLEFSSEYNRTVAPSAIPAEIKKLDPETGYILSGYQASSIHLATLILNNKFISKVQMDYIVPECGCIVVDYGSGMEMIVEHLKKQGIREALYLRKSFALGNYYAHIRYSSCMKACARCGIRFRSLTGPDFRSALEFIRRNVHCKAVITPQDTVADQFRMFLEKQHVPENRMPLITGSDCVSFAPRVWRKLSLKPDIIRQTTAAFDMLIHSPANQTIPDIEEIPVRLILPEEWDREKYFA